MLLWFLVYIYPEPKHLRELNELAYKLSEGIADKGLSVELFIFLNTGSLGHGKLVNFKGFDMVDEQELKVVDKRSQTSSNSEQASSSFTNSPSADREQTEDPRPMDFASFTVGLATQAMMLLGEIPEPQSGKVLPTNLAGARQTIDIISLLQEKTKGNLTADEDKLIQDVLTSLRIEFVKKAKK